MTLIELEEKFNSARGNAAEMVEAVIPLVNAYQQARKFDSAIRCLKETLPIIRDKGEMDQEAVILTALGTAYWEKAQLQKALNHFEEALALFEKADDCRGKVAVLSIVGVTFWRKCDWDKALEILQDAME
ncbi:MAG: tetratricopeptide repeat protein, partial [Nitrospina sp.]|nr:tetratricopeptide repeat protein [Nitrospina sp.]